MEDDQESGKTDHLIDEVCQSEYMPTPLESYETFKRKKKLSLDQETDQLIPNLIRGVMLYTLIDSGNERIGKVLEKLLDLDKHPAMQELSLENLSKTFSEQNLFGLTPEDYVQMINTADAVCEMGRPEEAIAMYQALTVLFPTFYESWLKLADTQSKLDFDYRRILDIYDQCLKIFDNPQVYVMQGLCHVKGQELKLAEESFNKALEQCDVHNTPELKAEITTLLAEMKPPEAAS